MADKIIQPHPKFKNPHIPDMQTYQEMYKESIKNPKRFFGKESSKKTYHGSKNFHLFITINLKIPSGSMVV